MKHLLTGLVIDMRRNCLVVAMALLAAILGMVGQAVLPVAQAAGQTSDRNIRLEATRNTRTLGGLPTRDGVVRAGLIYRSGALCYITSNDAAKLGRLRLRAIVDLRLPQEIEREGPDRLALTDQVARLIHLPMGNTRGLGAEAYRNLLEVNPAKIRAFFGILADADSYPLLFHCSAGKDRTGILGALLLMLLGAERTVIMDDYLQSQQNSPGLVVHK